MRKDSIRKHKLGAHNIEIRIGCVCVEKERAIFMVPKAKSGVAHPIHVQKMLHGSQEKRIFCEVDECKEMMTLCARSGMREVECEHLKRVSIKSTIYPNAVELEEEVQEELVYGDKLIKEEPASMCRELKAFSMSQSVSAVVEFVNQRYIHLSVRDRTPIIVPGSIDLLSPMIKKSEVLIADVAQENILVSTKLWLCDI